jgi:hypothetical protein
MDKKINLKLLRVDESENNLGIWEYYTFSANYENEEIASIAIDILKEAKDDSIAKSSFFMDFSFNPPKPRPYLFGMGTKENYRGFGIAGILTEFANSYFKNKLGIPIHSGKINNDSAIRVWEKLAEKGSAMEYIVDGDRIWDMF